MSSLPYRIEIDDPLHPVRRCDLLAKLIGGPMRPYGEPQLSTDAGPVVAVELAQFLQRTGRIHTRLYDQFTRIAGARATFQEMGYHATTIEGDLTPVARQAMEEWGRLFDRLRFAATEEERAAVLQSLCDAKATR